MEGSGSLAGRMSILILLTYAVPTHQYFSYQDCGKSCMNRGLPCNIMESINTFIIQCRDGNECEDRANDDVPCISEDRATSGGSSLWPIFREHKKPDPPPTENNTCFAWKIGVVAKTVVELIIGIVVGIQRFRKRRARIEYERLLAAATADGPYQSTTLPIPPEGEPSTSNSTSVVSPEVQPSTSLGISATSPEV